MRWRDRSSAVIRAAIWAAVTYWAVAFASRWEAGEGSVGVGEGKLVDGSFSAGFVVVVRKSAGAVVRRGFGMGAGLVVEGFPVPAPLNCLEAVGEWFEVASRIG